MINNFKNYKKLYKCFMSTYLFCMQLGNKWNIIYTKD